MTTERLRVLRACISQGRAPRSDEIDETASHVWREVFGGRRHWTEIPADAPERRCAMRIATAALLGKSANDDG